MVEYSKLKHKSGIYYFKNKINNKYYIGQAVDLNKRLRAHFSHMKTGRYDNIALYKAIRKYGIDNFDLDILEYVDNTKEDFKLILDEREKYYIEKYNSYGPTGYNQTLGGDAGVLGLKMTDEQKAKISKASKFVNERYRKKVYIWDFKNNKEYMAVSIMAAGDNPYIPISRFGIHVILRGTKDIVNGCTVALSEQELFLKRDYLKPKIESGEILLFNNSGRFVKGDSRIKNLRKKNI